MKLGAVFPQTEIGADPGGVRAYAEGVQDLGFEHLPHAYDEQAMYRQPGNYDERDMVIARARALRDTSPSVLRWGKRLAGSWRPVRRESRT